MKASLPQTMFLFFDRVCGGRVSALPPRLPEHQGQDEERRQDHEDDAVPET
jgi:hypothetical protein